MWPDNISAARKEVFPQQSVGCTNIQSNEFVQPHSQDREVDVGSPLTNCNDEAPSNTDVETTATTEGTEVGHKTPEVGMTFESLEAVDEFYTAFAKARGFGVILGGHKRDSITNEKKIQYWYCECGPPKSQKQNNAEVELDKSPEATSKRRKKSKKCGCGAGIAAFINKDGLWEIQKVELTHKNHAPTPSKSRFVPSFRDVPKFILRLVKDLIAAGVKQSQIYHGLANQLNGFENIPFLLKDMHNAVQKDSTKNYDEDDCREMFEYFAKMKEANDEFFYSWRVDEDNKLKDLVWVDARSRAAYLDFGDVVCFDATYITNRYELPFANFVGVNQHGQSILLGCALIRHEDSETYKWVMRQWLDCMGGVQPGGIITDQSTPMANAIEEVLPNSRHRLCVWHILSKVPRKLLAVKNIGDFHKKMKEVVYDSLSSEEFEGRWMSLITSFNLEGNEWLIGLWNDRTRWVPAYVKDVFWAGMSTTQRVESMHHFFKGFLNAKTTLRGFVQKYTRALEHRCNAEKVATANDDRRKARVRSTSIVEKHFQKVYTDAKFKEVQHECFSLMYCLPKQETQLSEHITEYIIVDRIQVGDPVHHVSKDLKVWLDKEKGEIRCTCRLFEHRGILCRHCIRVMEMTNMPAVPEKYVLRRWSKDIKRKHLDVKVGFSDPDKTGEEIRYGRLQYEYEKVFELAASSPELCDHAISKCQELFQELEGLRRGSNSTDTTTECLPSTQASNDVATNGHLLAIPIEGEGVLNPPVGKRIGRPPVKTPYGYPQHKKTKGSTNSKESTEGSVNKPTQSSSACPTPLHFSTVNRPTTYQVPHLPPYQAPQNTNVPWVHLPQADVNTPLQVPVYVPNHQLQHHGSSASIVHEYASSQGHFSAMSPSWDMGIYNGQQGSLTHLLARGLTANGFPSHVSFPSFGSHNAAPFVAQQIYSSASSYNLSSGARPPIPPSTSSSLPPLPC